jgi:hypothetical protein
MFSLLILHLTVSYSIANATADLLMIGAWTLALASIDGENIPVRPMRLFGSIALINDYLHRPITLPATTVFTEYLLTDWILTRVKYIENFLVG